MSQTCKFYQQGRCKYGDRCWNEHVDTHSSPNRYNQNSQYHYYASPEQTTHRKEQFRWSRDDIAQLLHLAREAAEQIEHCKMWPLTSWTFMKMKDSLPGWIDYSMEELRYAAYVATKFERFPQYQQDVEAVYSRARNARHILLKGGRDAENLMTSYLQSNESSVQVPGPSTNVFFANYSFDYSQSSLTFTDPAPGLFSRVTARTNSSGQSNPSMSTVNFGAVARPASPSGFSFASVAQKPQTSSPFSASSTPSPSAFPQSNSQQSPFASPSSFPQSAPLQESTPAPAASFSSFSFSSPPASQPVIPTSSPSSHNAPTDVYSRIQDLTDQELEQYRAATFTLGKIPIKPPPKELC